MGKLHLKGILILLLLVGTLFFTNSLYSQERIFHGQVYDDFTAYIHSEAFKEFGGRCGFDTKTRDVRLIYRLEKTPSDCDLAVSQNLNDYTPGKLYIIPTWVHVIAKDNGSNDVSDEMVRAQMDVLNEDYRAISGTLGQDGIDTRIQFKLSGITHYLDTQAHQDKTDDFKTTIYKDPNRFLNIYVKAAGGYLGYAYLPQDEAGTVKDGVVIEWSVFGRNVPGADPYHLGRTTTHEVGHYLGLEHPFKNGCQTATPPNCYANGDLICDTNPQLEDLYGCPSGSATCGSLDPIHNYLNYTDDECMTEFTTEQMQRMRCAIENYRETLPIILPLTSFYFLLLLNGGN
ncbi:MAG: zinc metalloprotease [Deltaproteobacteria bacterium]|nr:zinc metalloprotease [Deltaproteobacteria bacterium]